MLDHAQEHQERRRKLAEEVVLRVLSFEYSKLMLEDDSIDWEPDPSDPDDSVRKHLSALPSRVPAEIILFAEDAPNGCRPFPIDAADYLAQRTPKWLRQLKTYIQRAERETTSRIPVSFDSDEVPALLEKFGAPASLKEYYDTWECGAELFISVEALRKWLASRGL